nr:T9SS type A sorting domain-containing protein [Hymenobacter luteus]
MGATGSIASGLEKPVKDAQGNIKEWVDVSASNTPSIIIKSVFGVRINAQINNTSVIELPLCSGAQQLTLTLPQLYYDDAGAYPVEAYVWTVPSTFTVQNAQPATDFGPGRWLGGRSITVTAPASQLNEVVRVVLWSRECNQNPTYNNPPATLISFEQSVTIRRVPPTLTSVTASRAALTCGDQTPLTLTANLSQSGGASVSYTWPATLPGGWSYQTPAPRTGSSVVVIPSGQPGSISIPVSASYSCGGVSGTTPAVTYATTVSTQVGKVVFKPNNYDFCLGETKRLEVQPISGVTSYTWQLPQDFSPATATTTVPYLTVTAPSQGTTYQGRRYIRVTAGSGSCGTSSDTVGFKLGTGLVYFTSPYGDVVDGEEVCAGSVVTLWANLYNDRGTNTGYTWTASGGELLDDQGTAGMRVRLPGPGNWVNVAVRFTNDCGGVKIGYFSLRTVERFSNGFYCQPEILPRLAVAPAYPNPASEELIVPLLAGTKGHVRLFNGQGRQVRQTPAKGAQVVLDVRQLPEGLYQLQVPGPDGSIRHQQIQVQH